MIKRVIGVALIAVIGAACTEKSGDNPAKPEPSNGEKHYVKSIDMYVGDPAASGDLEYIGESIEFTLDEKSRIVNTRGVEYLDGQVVDVFADIKFEYNDNNNEVVIKADYYGESLIARCELNDRGAVTRARYEGIDDFEMVEERFEYNDEGELQTYVLSIGGREYYRFNYAWEDGNLARVYFADGTLVNECTYTDEPNPYNIDMSYSYYITMPVLFELTLIHDGFLGKTNRSMLTSCVDYGWGEERWDVSHKFDNRGLVEYSYDGDVVLKYECF